MSTINSSDAKNDINQLQDKLEITIKNLIVVFFSFSREIRKLVLDSMRKEAYEWAGCNSGSILELTSRLLLSYDKDNKDDKEDILLTNFYYGLDLSNREERLSYWLNLSTDMIEKFKEDFLIHSEWVKQGFTCERDYIASKCENCSYIYNDYTNTKPCKDCGEIWWTSC
jgi:hypothetical protein